MSTTTMPIPLSPAGRAVGDQPGPGSRPAVEASRPAGGVERRGAVKVWQRLAAVIWDGQPLRLQLAVYRASPRLATHLDELAHRRDAERSRHE